MTTNKDLENLLFRLDGKGYKAYKDIRGTYEFEDFSLIIDYVQGDPFAAPSRMRVQIPQEVSDFPEHTFSSKSRQIALRDLLTRKFGKTAKKISGPQGTGKGGIIGNAPTGQEILERSAVLIDHEQVEARFTVGLPAAGRKILGKTAKSILCEQIPQIVEQSLFYDALNAREIQNHIVTAEDADWLRSQLSPENLIAFIPDGAILPRRSGIDDRPLEEEVIPFRTPESLKKTFNRPNQGEITGMGIPKGINLIVGGGYHGKSTLLRAIEMGVYNHIPDDGREQIVADPEAVKIRAEDERSVVSVDISPFINNLPQGRDTKQFTTPNASGSTSQAANIMEALEAGAHTLLLDEDTSATNFMIRDHRMQELIAKDKEPITPFIDKIKQLYEDLDVSSILVMGGSGDYFDVADRVIAMENYQPFELTEEARRIAEKFNTQRNQEGGQAFGSLPDRVPAFPALQPSGDKPLKIKVRDKDEIVFGKESVDVSFVEQIADTGQLKAISDAMMVKVSKMGGKEKTIQAILDRVMQGLDEEGLDYLNKSSNGDLVRFRRFELAAVMNRLRSLKA